MTKSGCAYGQINREMITEVKSNVIEIKSGIKELNDKMIELYNHQSSRLPFGVSIGIGILASLVTGLAVALLK
jgi:hypothetical protein